MAIGGDFVEELRWRGMLHDLMPGTQERLLKGPTAGYVGIDPTADSLHIGHLVSIMILKHFQRMGHKPVVLIGGATGLIGDPSGKSQERNLQSPDDVARNIAGIERQLRNLLDIGGGDFSVQLVNNAEWIGKYSFIDFIRIIGKHITVNYMMSKDSVKRRLSGEVGAEGLSFTEFSYQLIQAADFLHLRRDYGVELQMGGSDQWGNITTGAELVRRVDQAEVYGITCPLITKADGTKFGKTEQGNVWLSPELTSPYHFYQFWLNTPDDLAERFIKIYTMLGQVDVEEMVNAHKQQPHARTLQRALAEQVTDMVHGRQARYRAQQASEILFGKNTPGALRELDKATLLEVFEGVPRWKVPGGLIEAGVDVVSLLTEHSGVYSSKGECRRAIQGGGLGLNKERVESADLTVNSSFLLNGGLLLVQKGKKEYHILHTIDL